MGYKAAVQVLKKADVLKAKVLSRQCDLLNDSQVWSDQQQLQTVYHQVLVLDLEYALDRKVEQELWTLGFKNHISILQEQARDKKNLRRSESQALLSWCLEAASGFYLTLLQELCSTYDLDLPFRQQGVVFATFKNSSYSDQGNLPQSSSCSYICQYCLVHLGDIARYRNQRTQAESFYKHAILVSPHSGHPYNQLALLEASQGDKLSTVFHYVRSISVKNPFPAATANLSHTLSLAVDKDDPLTEVQTKISVNEFIAIFLKAHGLLHVATDLPQAELCVKSITSTLTALIATQSFTTDKLIKMTVINLYALKHVVGDDVMKVDELTDDERKVRELILDLLAGSLSAFLLPVYTLKSGDSLLDYYALPAIRLISMWIQNDPSILTDSVFANRMQIWPGYCKLLNSIQVFVHGKDFTKYEKIPLSYDRELQGFLPLQEVFKGFDFKSSAVDNETEKFVRAVRLLDFGKWLTTVDVANNKLIISNKKNDSDLLEYEPGCIQPDPTDKLLEEMKSFKVADNEMKVKGPEKRGGILKPQGSLEKSREERVQVKMSGNEEIPSVTPNAKVDNKMKRITQNVALQSIYKKIEESKQVKFSAETTDKGKDKTSPKQKQPPLQQPAQQTRQAPINPPPPQQPQPPNLQYRTQTFNQNHPGLGNLAMDKNDFFNMNFNAQPPPQQQQQTMPPPMERNHQYQNPINKISQFAVQPPNIYNNPGGNNFTPLIEKPVGFAGYGERQTQNSWWPNQMEQRFQQQQPHDYFRFNGQPFGNVVNNMNPNAGQPQQTQGDLFGNTWANPPPSRNNSMPPPPNMGYGGSGGNHAMSMRQAMLNETKHMSGSNNANNLVNNAPGYSLFNTSSWTPTLPGQLRNTANTEMRQQSLFSGPAPQSLQQLLEQQSKLRKGDT